MGVANNPATAIAPAAGRDEGGVMTSNETKEEVTK